MKTAAVFISRLFYTMAIRPLLFRLNPEKARERIVRIGEYCGKSRFVTAAASRCLRFSDGALRQLLFVIDFDNPIGLSAGFDFEERVE